MLILVSQTTMRTLFALSLLLGACASSGTIGVTGPSEAAHFDFHFKGRQPAVMGIDVYELEHDSRGRTMCSLDRLSLWDRDVATMAGWQYGQDVGSNYRAQACVPLEPGHTYGINLFHSSACITMTRFRVDQNGFVGEVAASDTVCGR